MFYLLICLLVSLTIINVVNSASSATEKPKSGKMLRRVADPLECFCIKWNCYDMLGLTRENFDEQVQSFRPDDTPAKNLKKIMRESAKKYHPDKKGGTEEKVRAVYAAFEVLNDPNKKKWFDYYVDHPGEYGRVYFEVTGKHPPLSMLITQAPTEVVVSLLVVALSILIWFVQRGNYDSYNKDLRSALKFAIMNMLGPANGGNDQTADLFEKSKDLYLQKKQNGGIGGAASAHLDGTGVVAGVGDSGSGSGNSSSTGGGTPLTKAQKKDEKYRLKQQQKNKGNPPSSGKNSTAAAVAGSTAAPVIEPKMMIMLKDPLFEASVDEIVNDIKIQGGVKRPGWQDIFAIRIIFFPYHAVLWTWEYYRLEIQLAVPPLNEQRDLAIQRMGEVEWDDLTEEEQNALLEQGIYRKSVYSVWAAERAAARREKLIQERDARIKKLRKKGYDVDSDDFEDVE